MNKLMLLSNAELRSEFSRAVKLVLSSQVTTFREMPAVSEAEVYDDLEQRLLALRRTHGTSGTDGSDDASTSTSAENTDAPLQVQACQAVLVRLLDGYNDPFANYLSPDQLQRYSQRRSGNLTGVGLKFRSRDDDYPIVIGALLGGPLEHAGLEPGDVIERIDGEDQHGAVAGNIGKLLKGEPGTTVPVIFRKPDGQSLAIDATRMRVELHYARSEMLEEQTGYLRVSRFGGKTHERAAELLNTLLQQGARRLLLDLRDNPGGSTRAARAITTLFSDADNVYCERYETGGTRKLPRHGDTVTALPLVVLINEHSMSAAEIVAGALQDHGRAVLVGVPTYGKGLIQKVFRLKPPLGGAVRITIASYATPRETLIHGVGITPDRFVATAPRRLFAETGSLNISARARAFKRQLLEQRLERDLPAEESKHLLSLRDEQLYAGLEELDTLE